jgi:hypothetical protein
MIDQKALLAWLARKAKEAPVGDAPTLVQHAIYEGLAERIKSGEFTVEDPPNGWFIFGSHVDFGGQMEFSAETTEDGLPKWERPLPLAARDDERELCGDWPAPCNCIDPTTHDRSLE